MRKQKCTWSLRMRMGKSYNGTGIDFDVLTASAKAYIQASGKAKNKQTIEKVSAHF